MEIAEFIGEPPTDFKEPYDPWDLYRPIVPRLQHLEQRLEREIRRYDERESNAQNSPNAAKPKLDEWRARLVRSWESECHLPIENSKPLRGFLLAALHPYMPKLHMTDRMASHFITRWRAGEIKDPGSSLLRRLRDRNTNRPSEA